MGGGGGGLISICIQVGVGRGFISIQVGRGRGLISIQVGVGRGFIVIRNLLDLLHSHAILVTCVLSLTWSISTLSCSTI